MYADNGKFSYFSTKAYEPQCEETQSFEVFDQIRHKPGCAINKYGLMLEILDLERRRIVLSVVAKTKALISCVVTHN